MMTDTSARLFSVLLVHEKSTCPSSAIIVGYFRESEGAPLDSPRIRARHTLVPHLSMTMIETVKRVLGQSGRELVVECRQCGSNVGPGAESCPVCDSTEIARYDISR